MLAASAACVLALFAPGATGEVAFASRDPDGVKMKAEDTFGEMACCSSLLRGCVFNMVTMRRLREQPRMRDEGS